MRKSAYRSISRFCVRKSTLAKIRKAPITKNEFIAKRMKALNLNWRKPRLIPAIPIKSERKPV
jgi:hypothetical protein